MRNKFWEKRIPTLLGLIMIFFSVGVTSYLVKTGTSFIGRASPPETPENVRITNISSNSFAVSYSTADQVLGSLSYGKDKDMGTTVIDDRDQQTGNLNTHKIHYITVRNLTPSTKYYFSITSGQTTFLNSAQPFEVTTGSQVDASPSDQQPVVGKLVLENGNLPQEAILYLTIPGAQTLSTLAKTDGSYLIPLNSMLNKDLVSYFNFSQDPVIQMLAIDDTGSTSNILLRLKQINPIPAITLSKDFDFSIDTSPVASSSAGSGFPSFSASPSSNINAQIITPKKNETFTDPQPVFKGKALPGEDVKIIIHSAENIETSIKADSKGSWSYRPESPLSPGIHTITISSRDSAGIIKTLTQSFTVYAQGTQVDQPATPSATPIITLTPTNIPSPTISLLTPTMTPTSALTPTLTPTTAFTPTPTFIPIATITPTPKPIISAPGSSSLISAAITVITTTVIGIGLFLLTRGGSLPL
ncbi:hypothetical protein C4559_05980 [Candidatus Microgenomates bacterium]|nr:MAG: hypothetical protein C4559_05980 [Candidatus Microgenomates bacterium]